jgi:Na+/H+ antiporter NhaD/arsenite permease-like protein
MTVCAMLLSTTLFATTPSERLRYAALAVLFVNVSVGGTLTNFAAPPVLMVAAPWGWDLSFMLTRFGPRAALAVALNTAAFLWFFRKDLAALESAPRTAESPSIPMGLGILHLLLLGAVVATAHHPRVFVGFFLAFLGVVQVTREYQEEIKLREALLVAFFLAGLVVLGQPQRWWLLPVLDGIGDLPLYFGTAGLTAMLDNAALTYLGTQVPSLSESARYFLVAGAVAGGGLTVIANAPNPIGFSMLQGHFKDGNVSPLRLLAAALLPTITALFCLGVGA